MEDLDAEPTLENEGGNVDADIYGDLPDFHYDVTLDQLKASVAKLEAENHVLQSKLVKVNEEKKSLGFSYSALFRTAKLEIQRKERTISQLREQLNELKRKQPGLKMRQEVVATSTTTKRPNFNSRRAGEKMRPPRVESRTPSAKPKASDQQEVSTRAQKARCIQEVAEKENAPVKRLLDDKEPLVNGTSSAPCVTEEPCPEKTAPSLPAIECPTLFSDRMYKKIYGSSPKKAHNKLSTSTQEIKPDVDKLPKSRQAQERGRGKEEEVTPPSVGSSNQHLSTSLCKQVTPEDIRAYLGVEDSSDSDSSSCSTVQLSPCLLNSFASSCVKPQTHNSPFSKGDTKIWPSAQLEVPVHQPSAVEPLSAPSVVTKVMSPKVNAGTSSKIAEAEPPKPTESIHLQPTVELPVHEAPSVDFSNKLSVDRSNASSPVANVYPRPVGKALQQVVASLVSSKKNKNFPLRANVAKSSVSNVNSGPLGKARHQTVAAIRPIQKLVAQDIPAMADKTDKSTLTNHRPDTATENLAESKSVEVNSDVGSEKKNRHSKIPGLPGSAKGRTIRQVFAPISNQWSCSLPTSSNQNDCNRKGCSELSVVQTVSVTSELTVRVEDMKLDGLRKESLAEAVFGSPVKWADDSLDSPTPEGSGNSQKTRFYSIFGSPVKGVDSNSSEHPFSVPPGAYEESCWTNQIPEKVQKSSPVDAFPKQSQRSREPVPVTETKPKEISPERSSEKVENPSASCPPPPLSVIRKHVSIFSPMKDSKISSSIPDDLSRSNTGIFFPFQKTPKYEDSILGQFDDTAQFVSAVTSNLAVKPQISPLSTPVKSGDHLQSVIVKNNPTSFEEVFNKNVPGRSQPNHQPTDLESAVGTVVTNEPESPVPLKGLSDDKNTAVTSNQPEHLTHELEKENAPGCGSHDPLPPKKVEPPTITVTSTNSETFHYDRSFIVIHRPNLASSTKSFVVKSWFPKGTPTKWVTPRKTPRLVTKVSPTAAPKPYASIDFPIFFDQEGRTRSVSGSPVKSMHGSPTRKRFDLPGKISPSKRSPRKQVSPRKSLRQAELCRNIPCSSSANTPVSMSASHPGLTEHKRLPGSINQLNQREMKTDTSSVEANNCEGKIVPGSLDLTTDWAKSLVQVKESGVDPSTTTDRSGGDASGSALKHETACSKAQLIFHPKSYPFATTPHPNSAPSSIPVPSWFPDGAPINVVTPRRGVSSQFNKSDHFPINLKKDVSDAPLDTELSRTDTLSSLNKSYPDPIDLAMNAKKDAADVPANATTSEVMLPSLNSGVLPDCPTVDLKPAIAGNRKKGFPDSETRLISAGVETTTRSAEPAVPSLNPSNVTKTQASQVIGAQSITEVKTSTSSKTKATYSEPSKPIDSPECHAHTPPRTEPKLNGGPAVKSLTGSSKFASLITRVKPSTPLNKSVAALITSSINTTPSLSKFCSSVTTPNAQSTKQSNFKRSSALKSAQKGCGSNLMNSIQSTFYQTTPKCSETGESNAQGQDPNPRLVRRKRAQIPGCEERKIQNTRTSRVVTRSQKKENPPAESPVEDEMPSRKRPKMDAHGGLRGATTAYKGNASASLRERAFCGGVRLSEKPAEQVGLAPNFPGQWKLLEVDCPANSVSLLQRFKGSKENPTHHDPLDSERKGTPNTRTEISTATELNKDNAKSPLKSPVFSRSCLRKTILLDAPLKIKTPTKKRKRSGDPESPESKEVHLPSKSGDKSSARAPDGPRVTHEVESPEKGEENFTGPDRCHVDRGNVKENLPDELMKKYSEPVIPHAIHRERFDSAPDKPSEKYAEPERLRALRKEDVENTSPAKSCKKSEPEISRAGRRGKIESNSPRNSEKRYPKTEKSHENGRVSSERTTLKGSFKRPLELERRRGELYRKSTRIDIRARYFRRSRSVSSEVSSRRLRALKHNVTLKPLKTKSRTTHRDSPEPSARNPEHREKSRRQSRTSFLDSDEDVHRSSRKPESRKKYRTRSETSSLHPDVHENPARKTREKSYSSCSDSEAHERKPTTVSEMEKLDRTSPVKNKAADFSVSKSSARRSEITTSRSDGKADVSNWKTRVPCREDLSSKQSNRPSHFTGGQAEPSASGSASNPSKIGSCEPRKVTTESVDGKSVLDQVVAEVPQPASSSVPPWARSRKKVKVVSVKKCETPQFS